MAKPVTWTLQGSTIGLHQLLYETAYGKPASMLIFKEAVLSFGLENMLNSTAVSTTAFLRYGSCRGSPITGSRATPMQGITVATGTVTDITDLTAEMTTTAATMAIPIKTTVNEPDLLVRRLSCIGGTVSFTADSGRCAGQAALISGSVAQTAKLQRSEPIKPRRFFLMHLS